MNPLLTWANIFHLSSFKTANQLTTVFAGKVSAVLEFIMWKNNNKPLKHLTFPSEQQSPRTTAQLNIAKFCLSFKPEA